MKLEKQISMMGKDVLDREKIYTEIILKDEVSRQVINRDKIGKGSYLYCPYCKKVHVGDRKDMRLKDVAKDCCNSISIVFVWHDLVSKIFYTARPIDEDSFEIAKVKRELVFSDEIDLKITESYDVLAYTIIDINNPDDFGRVFVKKKNSDKYSSVRRINRLTSFPRMEGTSLGPENIGFEKLAGLTKLTERLGIKNLLKKIEPKKVDIEGLMNVIINHKKAEILDKTGFEGVIFSLYRGSQVAKDIVERKGTKLKDVIKVPKNLREKIKDMEPGVIIACENLYAKGEFDSELFMELLDIVDSYSYVVFIASIDRIVSLNISGLTTNRAMQYLLEVERDQAYKPSFAITTWMDYLIARERIEVPYKKYPVALKTAHDIAVRDYKQVEDEETNEKIREKEIVLRELTLEDDNYTILFPKTMKDLFIEGNSLGHCVGTYSSRVASGQTNIGFIRSKDNIEKPLYTIEFMGNKVIQIEGRQRISIKNTTNSELKLFVEKFMKNVEKKLNIA